MENATSILHAEVGGGWCGEMLVVGYGSSMVMGCGWSLDEPSRMSMSIMRLLDQGVK